MTGAREQQLERKRGQAMVEFLVGLIGLLFLMLGLFQIATIVVEDVDSLVGAREEVAQMLVDQSSSSASYSDANTYEVQQDFYGQFSEYIQYDDYSALMEPYDLDRVGFEDAIDDDPMSGMVGYQDAQSLAVESGLMRQVMGERFLINNEVWMPSWEPLMTEE